jgi:hypothetical protein
MKILFTLFAFALIVSCKTTKNATSSLSNSSTTIPKDPEMIATIGEFPASSDPIKIDTVQIIGNKMLISVSYAGGCGNHNFNLIGSQQIAKSMPAIRVVKLFHSIDNDNCKKMITRVLHFDISALAYKKESGSEIYLALDGYKEKLKYTFE